MGFQSVGAPLKAVRKNLFFFWLGGNGLKKWWIATQQSLAGWVKELKNKKTLAI